MLDFAEIIVINKFERRGADDALRDVRRQFARNRELFDVDQASLPVFGTVASRFNDDGVTALYQHLRGVLGEHGLVTHEGALGHAGHEDVDARRRDRPGQPPALPRRDHRDDPRLPRHHRGAGRCGPPS